jgi:hypothetical protein
MVDYASAKFLSSDNGVLKCYHLCSIANVQIPMIKRDVQSQITLVGTMW